MASEAWKDCAAAKPEMEAKRERERKHKKKRQKKPRPTSELVLAVVEKLLKDCRRVS